MTKLLITLLAVSSAFGQQALESTAQSILSKLNSGVTCTNGGGAAATWQPGMGGVRMTGLPPMYTSDLEALGSMVGPPLLMPAGSSCDVSKQLQNPRSTSEPSLQWSCSHLGQSVLVQIAYQSTTDNACYLADWNGTFKWRNCFPGLPKFATGANGALNTMLDWHDTSINWDAGGGRALYTPADLNGSAYGSLRWIQPGTPDGRGLMMTGDVFCRAFPKDSTCDNGTGSGTTTIATGGGAAGAQCSIATDCQAGNICYFVTPTSKGTCGPAPK